MKAFLIFSSQIFKKTITLQGLRLKLMRLNYTCTSLKSIIKLTKTSFSDSSIFIEKKTIENRLLAKSEILWAKKIIQLCLLFLDAWAQVLRPWIKKGVLLLGV